MVECEDRSDEEGCKANKDTLIIATIFGLVILLAIAILVVASIDISDRKEFKGHLMEIINAKVDHASLHSLCPVVVVSQGTKLQKTANQAFLQLLKRLHNNDISMVLKSLKVFQVLHSFYVNIKILIAFQTLLDPITVEKVLSDTNSKPQKMDWFSKIFGRKESVDVKSFREMLIDRNHKTSALRTNLAIIQEDEIRIEFNCLFYDWELSLHDKDIAKTHLCLQVCILQF